MVRVNAPSVRTSEFPFMWHARALSLGCLYRTQSSRICDTPGTTLWAKCSDRSVFLLLPKLSLYFHSVLFLVLVYQVFNNVTLAHPNAYCNTYLVPWFYILLLFSGWGFPRTRNYFFCSDFASTVHPFPLDRGELNFFCSLFCCASLAFFFL